VHPTLRGITVALPVGLLVQCACASSGQLVAARDDLGFVKAQESVFLDGPLGIERVSLDGRVRRMVFGASLHVEDVSADFSTFVLESSEAAVLLGDASGSVRDVPVLHHRLGAIAISPDGRTVVASRSADFSLPQSQWVDDDALYFIDVASLSVRTIPPSTTGDAPMNLAWSPDGGTVFAEMKRLHDPPAFERVSVADGARQWEAADPHRDFRDSPHVFKSPRYTHPVCPGRIIAEGWATELRVESAGATVVVARETGRERGFHDYRPDFEPTGWTPGCAEIIFGFQGETWLASAKGTLELGRLGQGKPLFFAPPFAAP
jgi:hypothetical protein